ncbi:ICOS ligand isoform X2 [Sceloporus undulatus]|uniref:ICOS ligand isoform X2 n=1 Tax=Sceloporus undulatus TaxID=8520 RepID=UPI001C4BF9A3|nr:ICOS ligand isoform X2 [Sceloporus undulatus]
MPGIPKEEPSHGRTRAKEPRGTPASPSDAARMAPRRLGFMVLFLCFQKAANATEVTGIIGGSVEMRCLYTEKEPFILNKFRVQWQKKNTLSDCFIDAYLPGEDMKLHQCPEFRNRTQFSEQLKKGNFSLRLLDIRPTDDRTYECLVQRNQTGKFEFFTRSSVTLKVAANYSKPVITLPVPSGKELIFICNSSHGYPLQNLKWINRTDNSVLNATEWHAADSDGTFSVSSTLMVKATSDTNLDCMIENQQLHQTIITTFDIHNSDMHHKSHIVVGVVAAIIAVIGVSLTLYCRWNKKRSSVQRTYID